MRTPFEPVSADQPLEILSEEYNWMLKGGRAQRNGQPDSGVGANGGRHPSPAKILVYNNTGSALALWGVVAIGAPAVLPTLSGEVVQQRTAYTATAPTANGIFAICQEPIPAGRTGFAIVVGVSPCMLTVADASHAFADCTTSTTELTTSCAGRAYILWKESGTGSGKRGVVLIDAGPSPKSISGWNASVQQFLTHNASGCLEWKGKASC